MSKNSLDDFKIRVLSSDEAYRKAKKYYITQIENNNKDVIKEVVAEVGNVFKQKKKNEPLIMLNALRLIKDTMDTKNVELITNVQINILPYMYEFAKFRFKIQDDDRGGLFFDEKPTENVKIIGNSFFRLLLECILFWSKWFPKDTKSNDTKFKQTYDLLTNLGVKFPEQINYFKPRKPLKNPEDKASIKEEKKEEKKEEPKLREIIDSIFQNLNSQKDFVKSLLVENDEFQFEKETFKMIMDELNKFNKSSPKFMEDVINSNLPEQEQYLSKLLNEQDLVQNIINNFDLFSSKSLKFRDFRAKCLYFLSNNNSNDKFQTPGEIIQEVPENLENMLSISQKNSEIKENNSAILKATNLDIANQKNKLKSNSNIEIKAENKLLDSKRINQIEESPKILNSAGSIKEILNESNQFLKEAQEHFEEPISLSEFKKVNLSPERDKESIKSAQGSIKKKELFVDLSEKYKKSSVSNKRDKEREDNVNFIESMKKDFEERLLELQTEIRNLREDNIRKKAEIKAFSNLDLEKDDQIRASKEIIDDLNKQIRILLMEKEEINEKFKNSAISHDSKLLFLSKELKDIKLKCEQQAKEIKSLKQTISESQKCNTSLQDFTKIHSLYNSPSQKIYSKNERLSVYQEKKMKFNKSPKNYNYMKFSNANAENFIISNQTSVTDLIYPFSKPNEYYNRLSKNPKSSNLYNYENLYFKDLINLSEDSLLRFKRCCLFQKHVLFDNGTLQIGTVSSYCTSEYNEYLRLSLFIGNMKETLIESISMNYFFLKDLNISIKQKLPDFIANKTQIKQELMVQYTMVPYQLLFNKLNYNCGFNSFEVSFALPLTINKFLRARYIEIEQFQKEWQINKSLSLKSNFFLVEEKLIKNDIYDFKTFFIDLVDLKPWKLDYYKSGIGDYKLAGSFKYGEEKYEKILWFKIVMTPKKEVAFQVFCQQPNFKEYFLNTLIFLFKKGI